MKLLSSLCLHSTPQHLPEWQYGCNCKNGAEKIIHAVRSRRRVDNALLTVDIKNAFNCMSRAALFTLLSGDLDNEALLRFMKFAYARPSMLIAGDSTILSAEGYRQGDVAASYLFAYGFATPVHEVGA